MTDVQILHEISEALRVLIARADAAGSTTARSILIMSASAIHDIAAKAEREDPLARTAAEMIRRLGEGKSNVSKA